MVGLLLALAIQLVQMQPALASVEDSTCATDGHHACCCTGADHCPCVKSAPERESKAPQSQVSADLKAQDLAKPSSTTAVLEPAFTSGTRPLVTWATDRLPIGFEGVPLSVAFCRFVI